MFFLCTIRSISLSLSIVIGSKSIQLYRHDSRTYLLLYYVRGGVGRFENYELKLDGTDSDSDDADDDNDRDDHMIKLTNIKYAPSRQHTHEQLIDYCVTMNSSNTTNNSSETSIMALWVSEMTLSYRVSIGTIISSDEPQTDEIISW